MGHADLMRIGTWNLAGRWSDDHRDLLLDADCDVWLLTEVPSGVELDDYNSHFGTEPMAPGRHWAAILCRHEIQPLVDPHPASVAVVSDDTTYCCSVLPWRSCGETTPWGGKNHGERMTAALADLRQHLPTEHLVWGGDWNQSLVGPDWAGSTEGRRHLAETLALLKLHSPAAGLSHRLTGHATIDHVAIGFDGPVSLVQRISARRGDLSLSDHDAYVVKVEDD
jgi:endonuclease/exonuclease/phosphatase family metal-dependent hydrolase